MPSDRFFHKSPLTINSEVILEESEDRHMRRVMRKKKGDSVELFNGLGRLVKASLQEKSLIVTALITEEAPPEPKIIAQALITPSKLDWVAEKCQELGATALWLFPADFSEKKMVSPALLARLKTLAITACKQSGRLFLMEILEKQALSQWSLEGPLFFGSTDRAAPPWPPIEAPSFTFIVGPEKGFSEKEKSLLQKAVGVSLSPAVLRTETASLVALAAKQFA